MPEPLRALIVEDSEDDAVLAVRRLSKAGYDVDYDVVEDADGLDSALAHPAGWDIVLSDYTLPAFTAVQALEHVRARDAELPFVVVSGTIGDERATELMRLGASDYVLKDHGQRLGPVVKRALSEARERALLDGAQQALVLAGREWLDTFESISDGVFVLDADGRIERCNRAAVELIGSERSALRGADALSAIASACGIESGVEDLLGPARVVLERGPCVGNGGWFEITSDPIVDEAGVAGFVVVVSDITDRKRAEQELVAMVDRLERAMRGTVAVAARMVESRDPYTAGHQESVAEFAVEIACRMGLSEDRVETVRIAGLLHDIGKIGVPAEILVKPGELTDVEWSLVRVHPQAGADILAEVEFGRPVAEIVSQHHERLDGSGYPNGLSGEEILLEARILAVADVAEAMLAHRPYRPACTLEATRDELRSGRAVRYDERAVDAMLAMLDELAVEVCPAEAQVPGV